MHIKIEEPYRPTETFQNLLSGNTFMQNDKLYMKVDGCSKHNAINLMQNLYVSFSWDAQVYVVDCDVTVRYRQ